MRRVVSLWCSENRRTFEGPRRLVNAASLAAQGVLVVSPRSGVFGWSCVGFFAFFSRGQRLGRVVDQRCPSRAVKPYPGIRIFNTALQWVAAAPAWERKERQVATAAL